MAADHLGGNIVKTPLVLPGPGYGFGLGFAVRTRRRRGGVHVAHWRPLLGRRRRYLHVARSRVGPVRRLHDAISEEPRAVSLAAAQHGVRRGDAAAAAAIAARRATLSARRALHAATVSEANGVRYLHLGTEWVQGAMRIAKPDAIELEYVQRMLAWMLWRPTASWRRTRGAARPRRRHADAIHAPARCACRQSQSRSIPRWSRIARLWFRLPPEDERLAVIVGDAQAWVDDDAHARSGAGAERRPLRPPRRIAGARRRSVLCRLPRACSPMAV